MTDKDSYHELLDRLQTLKHVITARKIKSNQGNPRRTKPDRVARQLLDHLVYSKWCVQQIKVNNGDFLPLEVTDCVSSYCGVTIDDTFVAKELQVFSTLLVEAANKFKPKYVNWWTFLTSNATWWFDP